MKASLISISAGSLLCALAMAQPSPPRYTVTDLGKVGGPPAQPYFITNNGLIGGGAAFSDTAWNAMLWFDGIQLDLATAGGLGGPNSMAHGVNARGQAVGGAEFRYLDPNGEDFCGFNSRHICRPFIWQNGLMAPLPLLSNGANGVAEAINVRGQIAGTSENGQRDDNCPTVNPALGRYQLFQFKPVIWQNGTVKELPTVSGDRDGIAFAINDRGQTVGSTGECAAFVSGDLTYLHGLHAVLWDADGAPHDLGNLGGVAGGGGNTAFSINNRGQVVGHMGRANGPAHAYVWSQETGMQDLGTLKNDFTSVALGINENGDIVGISLEANFHARAFVRPDGGMLHDLNALIPANSPLFLFDACSINSRGEIIGIATDSAGNSHGYLATPGNATEVSADAPPANDLTRFDFARKLLQQRQTSGRVAARAFPRR